MTVSTTPAGSSSRRIISTEQATVAIQPDLTLAFWLSSSLVVVALVASTAGVFIPNLFRMPAVTAGNAQGTDLVILVVALPTLVVALILAARGSLRAQVVWLGALAYLIYNSVPFAFSVAFNQFFLVYIAALSLSFWSLLVLLLQIDAEGIKARFAPATPVRGIAVYMIVLAVLFIGVWLMDIVPAILNDTIPASLPGTGWLTSWVEVLDLSFSLPVTILAAIWLWQRRAWGYPLAGMMLVMLAIESASIATDQFFGHLADPNAPLSTVPMFVILTLVGLVPLVIFFRNLRSSSALSEEIKVGNF